MWQRLLGPHNNSSVNSIYSHLNAVLRHLRRYEVEMVVSRKKGERRTRQTTNTNCGDWPRCSSQTPSFGKFSLHLPSVIYFYLFIWKTTTGTFSWISDYGIQRIGNGVMAFFFLVLSLSYFVSCRPINFVTTFPFYKIDWILTQIAVLNKRTRNNYGFN